MQLSQTVVARQARFARPFCASSSRSAYLGTRIQLSKTLGELSNRRTAPQGCEGTPAAVVLVVAARTARCDTSVAALPGAAVVALPILPPGMSRLQACPSCLPAVGAAPLRRSLCVRPSSAWAPRRRSLSALWRWWCLAPRASQRWGLHHGHTNDRSACRDVAATAAPARTLLAGSAPCAPRLRALPSACLPAVQAAKSLGSTLRSFAPTIREITSVSQELKSTLEQVCALPG